ncbi:MAG: YggS family pyridoxal phosphate-dependent enzyme [Actinobacteria bacterium]|nr:YggS family pyridoxal phosphate-dependent enzyme [Actinomycetota bacterium]MBW3643498.1 YggS family pyridoxal phosphate-dependent enzyme [Actinomycetota bacterium]
MSGAAIVSEAVERVRDRIATAGGDPSAVRLVAVTKGFGPGAVAAAVAAGVVDVGESYASELVGKANSAPPGVRWHFVGRLQSNKVKPVASLVELWQSVDRPSLVRRLGERVPGARVLVQVNASGEVTKGGCRPADARDLVAHADDAGLDVRGLMTIGATGDPEDARPGFRLVRELADRLGLPERSMGMSGDLEVAVQEGSTMVRVGRALFGPRPTAVRGTSAETASAVPLTSVYQEGGGWRRCGDEQ